MSLLVLCPTRGRPQAAAEAYASFLETRERDDTGILFVVNDDEDPAIYGDLPLLRVSKREWMNEVLQSGVDRILATREPTYLGFIGDDNRFRTPGWDSVVDECLSTTGGGFAYANDLARTDLPTHVFVNTSIVRALGYFGLRGAHHLYIDNAWKVLATAADCLYFFPDVVIEHLHPLFGKGVMDTSYEKSNAPSVYEHDGDIFDAWLRDGVESDARTVREAIGA